MYKWHVLGEDNIAIATFFAQDDSCVRSFMEHVGCTNIKVEPMKKEDNSVFGKIRGIINFRERGEEKYELGYMQVAL